MQSNIYPDEIRHFEKELIDFIVESGKNKRNSEIESHILAYFLFHPTLTQKEIQELSGIFREKKISIGSISNFLNKYEDYHVITRAENPEKRGVFTYALKDRNMKSLMATGLEAGFEKVQDWIEFVQERLLELNEMKIEANQIEFHKIFQERLEELRNFLVYHYKLMKKFLTEKNTEKGEPLIKGSREIVEKLRKKKIDEIELEIITFIQDIPLFMIDEIKYFPIYCYLLTRKRLSQTTLQKLTKLSSGTVSEGLNYLLMKELIELDKIKGTRMRFYTIPSIAYSNYLKQYRRFIQIKELKFKIEVIYQNLIKRESELKGLNGYEIVRKWVEQIIELLIFVEKGINIFEQALKEFKIQKKK